MTPRALRRIAAALADEPAALARDPFAMALRAVVRAAQRANRLELQNEDGPPTVQMPVARDAPVP